MYQICTREITTGRWLRPHKNENEQTKKKRKNEAPRLRGFISIPLEARAPKFECYSQAAEIGRGPAAADASLRKYRIRIDLDKLEGRRRNELEQRAAPVFSPGAAS